MLKRKHEDVEHAVATSRSAKRTKCGGKHNVLDLSDELILKCMSYLSIPDLSRCERVCRKLQRLARDNEIWKEKFYNNFVRPRARRLPIIKTLSATEQENSALLYRSRASQWLEHSHLVRAGSATDWKQRYKIKFNWTRGRARRTELQIGSGNSPKALVKVQSGYLITADSVDGLKIWRKSRCLAQYKLGVDIPTAMSVDTYQARMVIAIGFLNGKCSVFELTKEVTLVALCERDKDGGSMIGSTALAWPHFLTISASREVELLEIEQCKESGRYELMSLTSLHCEAEVAPVSLNLRRNGDCLTAGVAYAFNRFNSGWCLGLQEIRMSMTGTLIDSRAVTTIDTPLRDTMRPTGRMGVKSRSASSAPFSLHPQIMRPPNSLSYCGCYILAGLSDNTLMVYTVTSTDDKLEINSGRRLWGHTSAVSAAEVTSTGKALSISCKSDEMRYWELEELLTSYTQKRTSTPIKSLGSLRNAIEQRGNGLGLALTELQHEIELTRRTVAFDDEQAIVLGERGQTQVLSCFDFA